MTTNTATKSKVRPTLSASDLEHLLYLCKSESPISDKSLGLIYRLAPLLAKISGSTTAHTHSPTHPVTYPASHPAPTKPTKPAIATSNLQYWEQCHNKYIDSPAECSGNEIEAAQEHRYLNDLMSPDEKAVFESASLANLGL